MAWFACINVLVTSCHRLSNCRYRSSFQNGTMSKDLMNHLSFLPIVRNKVLHKVIVLVIGVILGVVFPYVHLGVIHLKIWVPNKQPVDRNTCSCSCFDTVFRGSYEDPGNVGYKHLYFNTTANMAKMWLLTVVFLLLFYESLRYLYKLWQRSCSVRWGFLILYVIQLYPHYYSWWSFLTYYNEELYAFFTHHFVFMVTELLSTVIVLVLTNAKNQLNHRQIGVVVAIGLTHLLVAGLDQFVAHLIRGQGKAFQNARNLGLMVPDLVHVIIPSLYFYRHRRSAGTRMFDDRRKREIILLLLLVTGGVVCGRVLFP